jgi:hypothetical protein
MAKNAYECLQYSYDWLKMENGSKDMENILYFKISRWKNALEKQMSEIEDKSSQEYQDLKIVRDTFDQDIKVTSYNEFKKANGVENVAKLKDFLAYGLFCNKISIYEDFLEKTPKSMDGRIKFYRFPKEKCAEVLGEYDKKIEEIKATESIEEQALNTKLQTLIKKRDELSNCAKAYDLISTEDRRKIYDKEIKDSQSQEEISKLNSYSKEEALELNSYSQEEASELNNYSQEETSDLNNYNRENIVENSSDLKQTQSSTIDHMPLELQRVLERSGILVDDSNDTAQMTNYTIPATKLISKSVDAYKIHDKMNPENQYLGELYKWAALVYQAPKIFLNEKDQSGNRIYVCDYGIFVVGTNIVPTNKYPKGYISNTNTTNHIYGVTTLRADGTNSQHMVISETSKSYIKNNKEFCTNVFFNEKYMELAEKKNSHYLGLIKKNDNSEYVIDVNQIFATETVNALNLALAPYNEILFSHDFEDKNGNIDLATNKDYWYKYCTGIIGTILTESDLKAEIADRHADLQDLFTKMGIKQLEVIQNINDRKKSIDENTKKIIDPQSGLGDYPEFNS